MTRPLGRRPPHDPATHPRLHLGAHLDAAAVAPPPSVDWVGHIHRWPIYLNDRIGDCTCAAAGHQIQGWTGTVHAGHDVRISDHDVLAAYKAVSGYNGDPSTDNGAVMQDVLGYWRSTGIGGHRIGAFAQLDPRAGAKIMAALWLFGGLYVGVNLPQSAEQQFDARHPWTTVHGSPIVGGHAVHVGKADKHGFVCSTWGLLQRGTWDWWANYVEEVWVPISVEWLAANRHAPNGLDVAGLNREYTSLTGEAGPFA